MAPVNHKKALVYLSKADSKLGKLIKKAGACELVPDLKTSPYAALFRSIVFQQLHGKAAATILQRVKDIFPHGKIPTAEEILKISDERLRQAGLSRNKTMAIKDLAVKSLEGHVPTRKQADKMSDEELVTELVKVRGIGPWTVEMLLIFTLGRLDVLPCTDFGVRQGFMLTYRKKEIPTPKELTAYGEKWRPYRSIASWYMWRAADMAKE